MCAGRLSHLTSFDNSFHFGVLRSDPLPFVENVVSNKRVPYDGSIVEST